MPHRMSLMLGRMIVAVDEGFSFDGIVSVPEAGLEDVTYRTGLAGLLDKGLEHIRTMTSAISRRIRNKPDLRRIPRRLNGNQRRPEESSTRSNDSTPPGPESGGRDPRKRRGAQGDRGQPQPSEGRDPRIRRGGPTIPEPSSEQSLEHEPNREGEHS